MRLFNFLKKKKTHINPNWKKINAQDISKKIREELFEKVNNPNHKIKDSEVWLAYVEKGNMLYKVVMKPDYESSHFNFDFYKRKK
jgi:hypothetical protein